GPGDIHLSDADIGLQSLGVFPTMFARYHVFGVDPSDPNHLIAADYGAGNMKSSRDGGNTWSVDPQLTTQVTGSGAFRFGLDGFPLVSAIGWDPENSCHILIGTVQNGVFRSKNGGRTWTPIDGSQRIT